MRREIELWFKQAEEDLKNAKKNVEIKAYYVAAFLAHQAADELPSEIYTETIAKRKVELAGGVVGWVKERIYRSL